jgi:para-nitrobenzyl esterase
MEMRMARHMGFSLAPAALASVVLAAPNAPPDVRLSSGALKGTMRDGVAFFGNIPFAAPPTGPERWRAPWYAKWERESGQAFGWRPAP